MNMKFDMAKAMRMLSTTIVIAVGVSSVAGAWLVYKNHVWRPKVQVEGVDFNNGKATLLIKGKKKTLLGNSVVWAGGDWGVRFGSGIDGKYNRIELIKAGMVHDILIS